MPFQELSSGVKLHYLDEVPASGGSHSINGNIVLLHGLGVDSSSWQLQIPLLIENKFRVIAPDTPGFGKSTYPGGGTSIARVATQITSLLNKLNIYNCILVGISMGGTIVLQMAIDNPELVQKLILVNTFAKLRIESIRVLPYFLIRLLLVHTLGLPAQARAVAKRICPYPEQEILRQELIRQVAQADPAAYRAAMRALAFFDVRKWLCEIHCPTLVISGEADNTVPLPNQLSLVQGIPGALHLIIPGAGRAVSVEKPDQFNHALLEFLIN
jgi:3-oxoadipate enol-lactonase